MHHFCIQIRFDVSMQKLTTIVALSCLLLGCNPQPDIDEFIPTAQTFASGQYEVMLIGALFRSVAIGESALMDSLAPTVRPTTEIRDNLLRIRIPFGDSVLCKDGRVRSGTLNMIADPNWPEPGTQAQVIPANYRLKSRAGNTAILEALDWVLHGIAPGTGNIPILEHRPRGLTWRLGSSSITWNSSFRQIMLSGFLTPELVDDIYLLETESDINLNTGTSSLRVAPPLLYRPECRVFTGGKAAFQEADETLIILDFGLDECEETASIRYGEDEDLIVVLID